MKRESKVIDRRFLIQCIRDELNPTWRDMSAKPDMTWVIPMVKELLYEEMLLRTKGNQSKAAKELGINRGHFTEQLKKFRDNRIATCFSPSNKD